MKRLSYLLSFLFASFLPPAATTAEQNAPATSKKSGVVAEVNSAVITRAELDSELRKQFSDQLSTLETDELQYARKQLLNKMIDRRLLYLAGEEKRTMPSDEELQSAYARLKGEASGGQESFSDYLLKNNLSEQKFLAGLREDLTITRYLQRFVFADRAVTDADIQFAFEQDPKKFAPPEEVRARQILFALPPDATPELVAETTARAQSVLELTRKENSNFVELAKRYSDAPNKQNGGDLGFLTRNQLDSAFADTAFQLTPGEVSSLVRTKYGLHIIRLEERRGGHAVPLEQVKDKIKARLIEEQKDLSLRERIKKLRQTGKVIIYLD